MTNCGPFSSISLCKFDTFGHCLHPILPDIGCRQGKFSLGAFTFASSFLMFRRASFSFSSFQPTAQRSDLFANVSRAPQIRVKMELPFSSVSSCSSSTAGHSVKPGSWVAVLQVSLSPSLPAVSGSQQALCSLLWAFSTVSNSLDGLPQISYSSPFPTRSSVCSFWNTCKPGSVFKPG